MPESETARTPNYTTVKRGAGVVGVSVQTFRTYISKGYFPVYKLPGVADACVDLVEVNRWLATRDRNRARPNYGKFGPDAIVRDLSNVAGKVYEVQR